VRRAPLAAILLAALASARPARAGNAETFYLGNDAALLAGAASASVQGASAVWYNPARIQEGRADAIDLGGSAYLLRFGGSPDLEAAPGVPATRQKLVTLDFNAVPTAFALKRDIFGVHMAAGVFVPNRTVSYPRTLVKLYPQGQEPAEVALDGNERFTEYYAGAGFGVDVTPTLSLGASLFGYYSSEVDTLSLAAKSGSSFLDSSGTIDQQRVGLQGVTGLAWRVERRVRVAFVLRTPVLQLLGQTQESQLAVASGTSGNSSQIGFNEAALGAQSGLLTPLRAEVGAAVDVTRATTVAVDAKMRGALSSSVVGRTAVPMIDVRAGARSRVGRSVWLGTGLFTDRSAEPRTSATGATVLDFYGTTLAFELGHPYRAVDEDHEGQTLLFSTALALSYAIGIGTVGNVAVTPLDGSIRLESKRVDVVAHEFMFMIGTSLSSTKR
jgi:hypothetical protein